MIELGPVEPGPSRRARRRQPVRSARPGREEKCSLGPFGTTRSITALAPDRAGRPSAVPPDRGPRAPGPIPAGWIGPGRGTQPVGRGTASGTGSVRPTTPAGSRSIGRVPIAWTSIRTGPSARSSSPIDGVSRADVEDDVFRGGVATAASEGAEDGRASAPQSLRFDISGLVQVDGPCLPRRHWSSIDGGDGRIDLAPTCIRNERRDREARVQRGVGVARGQAWTRYGLLRRDPRGVLSSAVTIDPEHSLDLESP
jgi:hypothetical protein